MQKSITELKNKHAGCDIWVLASGASMNFIDNSFNSSIERETILIVPIRSQKILVDLNFLKKVLIRARLLCRNIHVEILVVV